MEKKYIETKQENIIELKNLSIEYRLKNFTIFANDSISLNIRRNSFTAFVGESGSGKTTLAVSLIDCLVEPGIISQGNIVFHGINGESFDILRLGEKGKRSFRWEKISMVFQGAQSSLNPVMTVYHQFRETYLQHCPKAKERQIRQKSEDVLKIVNLDANRVLRMYPHELSGGMKQRVMIAFALLLDPEMIILDEPTTALDVITQEYIFSILKNINKTLNVTMILLTHDIAIVARYADYLAVMYGGHIMEYGTVEEVFEHKYHPYTEGLIKATPSLISPIDSMKPITGEPPSLSSKCSGCIFAPRCPKQFDRCISEIPVHHEVSPGHVVKCHLYDKETKTNG